MRQPSTVPSLTVLSLIVALTLSAVVAAQAQQAATARLRPATKAAEPMAAIELPVTRVSLYKNGVGFFEHDGRVTGSEAVTIDFTTAQLNDVLQSLTAVDLDGGRIAGAGYNSTTPVEEQLKSLPLALGEEPTTEDFYNAIRGARVEVRAGGATITGRLLNIEIVSPPASGSQAAPERRLITVIGEGGEVRTVELTAATEVHLLDPGLQGDLTRYLQLLASTRNEGLRHLTLQANGTGTRELHVSYLSEVPIWKSTYRILFAEPKAGAGAGAGPAGTAAGAATLQGWSVVDNTTGTDWVNVQLSLIAGAPQSFIQPLSVPYYSRRPEIALPQEAQLTPQTHESGEEKKDASASVETGSGGGVLENGTYSQLPLSMNSSARVLTGRQSAPVAQAKATAGGIYGGTGQTNLNENYMDGLAASNLPNTTTSAFDDYFAYNLTEPITIRKNESALVPILQTKVDAERVTLWSPEQPTPLRALWMTNTSNLTLDRGSFTIVEDGAFGGEGLLDPIHPAEKRLLSYAVDQAVHVSTEGQTASTHNTSITAAKGVLVIHHSQIAEITYVVHNAAPEARTVIVEQPIHRGYELDNVGGPGGSAGGGPSPDPKPVETTPTLYRYRVITGPGETVRLHVGERLNNANTYVLTQANDNQFALIANQAAKNPAAMLALQPILEARRHVAEMQTVLDAANGRVESLRSDEERQRANVAAVAGADKASRDRFVRDLNATEDQIVAAQKAVVAAQGGLQAAKDELANRIAALQIDSSS